MTSLFQSNLQEHSEIFRCLPALEADVNKSAALIVSALERGHKLLLCGNGGSASDSQHIAAEFTGRFEKERRPLAAVALSTDTSALTCIGNDYGFDEVFSRQLAALGRAGDCLVAISTSGNSRNVIRAAETARSIGIRTIGFLGRDGGRLLAMCDASIVVPSEITARIQEAHIFIGHILCSMIEDALHLA